MKRARILIVDDEQSMRDFLRIFFAKQGYDAIVAENGLDALGKIKQEHFDLVMSDIRMPEMDGMRLLNEVRNFSDSLQVIIMTAYGSTSDAIKAMKFGAYDYITKPFQLEEVRVTVEKALEKTELLKENRNLKEELDDRFRVNRIIGKSKAMEDVFSMIRKVADTKTNILISGESGTGKELAARAIHGNSNRKDRPFVSVNCGAIPGELMESELFGHKQGSFTGAIKDKDGLFLAADGGTIFLDEIGELPLQLQVKLLRALQERKIMPVGETKEKTIDTRVLAATNRDLKEQVARGLFREDLYYRLNVIQIHLPPLTERRDDIPLLVRHFVTKYSKEMGLEPLRVSEAAMMILSGHDYPGNVRELANIVERAVTLETTESIRPESLPPSLLERFDLEQPEEPVAVGRQPIIPEMGVTLDSVLEHIEREYIVEALENAKGVKKTAADLLGISFRSLRYRLKKLDLEPNGSAPINGKHN